MSFVEVHLWELKKLYKDIYHLLKLWLPAPHPQPAVLPTSPLSGLMSTCRPCRCWLRGCSGPWSPAHMRSSSQRCQRITASTPCFTTPQEVWLSTWSPLPPRFHKGIPFPHAGLDNTPLMGWPSSCSHPSPPLLGFPGATSQINDWCFHLCLRLILRESKLRNSLIYFSFYLGPLSILFPLLG